MTLKKPQMTSNSPKWSQIASTGLKRPQMTSNNLSRLKSEDIFSFICLEIVQALLLGTLDSSTTQIQQKLCLKMRPTRTFKKVV